MVKSLVYQDVYQEFSNDKHQFFELVHSTGAAKARAKQKAQQNYYFLARNRVLIEQEFDQLFTTLKDNGQDKEEFWLYCYYLSKMLSHYYAAYDNKDKAQSYKKQATLLKARIDTELELLSSLPENDITQAKKGIIYLSDSLRKYYVKGMKKPADIPTEIDLSNIETKLQDKAFKTVILDMTSKAGNTPVGNSFLDNLQQQVAKDLGTLASTPKHISKIRDWVAFANIWRIHMVFCRITIRQTLLLAQELKWLDFLASLFGKKLDIDGMVSVINAPTAVFNVLSVGLFAARFIINAGMLLKHTFFPSENEMTVEMKQRFYLELKKRYCDFLNDTVWGTVNALTNFAKYTGLSAPVVSGLMVGFMSFDVLLLTYRRHLARQEYLAKQEQYKCEINNIDTLILGLDLSSDEQQKYRKRQQVIEEQLKLLEINWKKTNATYLFNMAAAALLMSGFSASLLLAACPPAATVCYMVCTIAVAMYLTADIFGKYREKSLILEQARKDHKDTRTLQLEVTAARNDFILAMVKNTVMPLLIVTTFAICWEAALILTALYIGYECLKGYFVKPKQETPPAAKEVSANDDTMPTRSYGGSSFLAVYKPPATQTDNEYEDIANPMGGLVPVQ